MGRQLTDLTFEQWLAYVFDHPVDDAKQAWYWDVDRDWWDADADPADTIQFLTQAFEYAAVVFQPFSDAQLNQGLWFIASNSCSNHMFALLDASVPWPARSTSYINNASPNAAPRIYRVPHNHLNSNFEF